MLDSFEKELKETEFSGEQKLRWLTYNLFVFVSASNDSKMTVMAVKHSLKVINSKK